MSPYMPLTPHSTTRSQKSQAGSTKVHRPTHNYIILLLYHETHTKSRRDAYIESCESRRDL